jgi:TRAP-type C4-dicarboxylate transport system permease small subunit
MRRALRVIETLESGVRTASRVCNWIAMLSVCAMMLLTVSDVILRLFRRPITGAYELVSLAGTTFVSFSLAFTSVERGHIAVDFLVQKLRTRGQRVVDSITSFVCTALFGFISWQALRYAANLRSTGEVSLTLQVPLYPFAAGISLGCALLCIVFLTRFIGSLVRAMSDISKDK